MCKMWVGLRRTIAYQSNPNLQLLSKPITQLSVIELKVLQEAKLCACCVDA